MLVNLPIFAICGNPEVTDRQNVTRSKRKPTKVAPLMTADRLRRRFTRPILSPYFRSQTLWYYIICTGEKLFKESRIVGCWLGVSQLNELEKRTKRRPKRAVLTAFLQLAFLFFGATRLRSALCFFNEILLENCRVLLGTYQLLASGADWLNHVLIHQTGSADAAVERNYRSAVSVLHCAEHLVVLRNDRFKSFIIWLSFNSYEFAWNLVLYSCSCWQAYLLLMTSATNQIEMTDSLK